jgi:TonB family protein
MASSRIALTVLITLFTAGAAFSQEGQNEAPTPQSPVPNSSTPKPKRIRVGGAVASANLIHRVAPVYPKEAKKKHITGAVLLHATIGKDGTIENLEYVSGPPELTPSAMEAVKQWRYKPTLLRGEPIEVDTTISVVYTLGREDPNGATGSNSPSEVSDSPQAPPAEVPSRIRPRQSSPAKAMSLLRRSSTRSPRYILRMPRRSTFKELCCST